MRDRWHNRQPASARLAVAAAVLVIAAGCAPAGDTASDSAGSRGTAAAGLGLGPAKVDVDTPALRRAKAAAGVAPCRPGKGTPVEGGLPSMTLPCFGGGPAVDLSTLRGPLVVNLWSQTCVPCRREMPLLESFHQEYGDRVGVLGIGYADLHPDSAMDLVRRTGVTYPLLADPEGRLVEPPLRVVALPFLALVDAEGRVRLARPMVVESRAQLIDLVAEHLGVTL